jgi:hypothetical protein
VLSLSRGYTESLNYCIIRKQGHEITERKINIQFGRQ